MAATTKPLKLHQPHISLIEPGLYLGDHLSSLNSDLLTEHNIGAMLSLSDMRSAGWSTWSTRELIPEDCHIYLPCLDNSTQDLTKEMARLCDFMDERRRDGRSVLVHCMAGISRSTTIAVAHLMRRNGQSRDDALAAVKKCRNVKPNANFMEQLAVWEETGYVIWEDEEKTTPKEPYAIYLAGRAERLKALGLTGNEPAGMDLNDPDSYNPVPSNVPSNV